MDRGKYYEDLDISIAGLDVLLVEYIVDTGMTLNYVLAHLASHNPGESARLHASGQTSTPSR